MIELFPWVVMLAPIWIAFLIILYCLYVCFQFR